MASLLKSFSTRVRQAPGSMSSVRATTEAASRAELTEDRDVVAQERHDVVLPMGDLVGLRDLHRGDEPHPRCPRGLDGPDQPLLRSGPAEEQQEVLLLLDERVRVEVDAVV